MFTTEEYTFLLDALITAKCCVLPHAVVGILARKSDFMRQGLRDALIPHCREPGEDRLYLCEGAHSIRQPRPGCAGLGW
jgi:hypothetical protein